MSTFRGVGANNGVLPAATGQVIGFMRDAKKLPYVNYTQMIPVPTEGNGLYRYAVANSDEFARLVSLDTFAWGLDDPAPKGDDFTLEFKWTSGQTTRYVFAYNLGDRTQQGWQQGSNINLMAMYDQTRLSHAMLHRAARVVGALASASWGSNTATMASISGVAGGFIDLSSGEQYDAAGAPNPGYQIIKKALNRIKRRIHIATKGAVSGAEMCWVMGPDVAIALSEAGEIRDLLKQSQFARDRETSFNVENWGIPESYGGFKLVVEDTVRVFMPRREDGTVASPTNTAQTDYLMSGDTSYFVSRVGGLDGIAGAQSFSTVQLYHFGGEAIVEGERDNWNKMTKGRIITEDNVEVPAVVSGFKLTDMLA